MNTLADLQLLFLRGVSLGKCNKEIKNPSAIGARGARYKTLSISLLLYLFIPSQSDYLITESLLLKISFSAITWTVYMPAGSDC